MASAERKHAAADEEEEEDWGEDAAAEDAAGWGEDGADGEEHEPGGQHSAAHTQNRVARSLGSVRLCACACVRVGGDWDEGAEADGDVIMPQTVGYSADTAVQRVERGSGAWLTPR